MLKMHYYLETSREISLEKVNYDTCISVCLFKMRDKYREFKKYIEPIFRWIKSIPKNSYVRLYVDASVLEDESFIKLLNSNVKNLEICFN